MYSVSVFYIGITLINVYLNLLNWFLSVILVGGLLAIVARLLIVMIAQFFCHAFVNAIKVLLSTVPFIALLDS